MQGVFRVLSDIVRHDFPLVQVALFMPDDLIGLVALPGQDDNIVLPGLVNVVKFVV